VGLRRRDIKLSGVQKTGFGGNGDTVIRPTRILLQP
jgi:hypothetical protein